MLKPALTGSLVLPGLWAHHVEIFFFNLSTSNHSTTSKPDWPWKTTTTTKNMLNKLKMTCWFDRSPTQGNLKCKCPTQTTVKPENQAGPFEKTC